MAPGVGEAQGSARRDEYRSRRGPLVRSRIRGPVPQPPAETPQVPSARAPTVRVAFAVLTRDARLLPSPSCIARPIAQARSSPMRDQAEIGRSPTAPSPRSCGGGVGMARRSTNPLISASRRRTHVLTGGSASLACFLDPSRRPFALALEAIASSRGSAKPSTGVSDAGAAPIMGSSGARLRRR